MCLRARRMLTSLFGTCWSQVYRSNNHHLPFDLVRSGYVLTMSRLPSDPVRHQSGYVLVANFASQCQREISLKLIVLYQSSHFLYTIMHGLEQCVRQFYFFIRYMFFVCMIVSPVYKAVHSMRRRWNPLSGLHATRCTHVHSLIKGQDAQSCTLYKAPFTLLADGRLLTCPSMVAAMRSMRYLLASRSAASRKILLRSSCGRFSHALRAFRLASIAFFSKSWQQQRNIMRQNTPPLCAQIQSACMYYLMLNIAIRYFHKIQGTGLLRLRSKSLCLCPSDQVSVSIWQCVCVHLTMCMCPSDHVFVSSWPCVCVFIWPCVCVFICPCLCPSDHVSVFIWPCVYVFIWPCVCSSDHESVCPSDHVSVCPSDYVSVSTDHASVSIWPCRHVSVSTDHASVSIWPCVGVHLTIRLCPSDHVGMCLCPLTKRLCPSDHASVSTDHASVSIWPCVYLTMCLHWHK